MLTSGISNTYWCHSVGEHCNFMDSLCFNFSFGRCYANDFGQLGVIGRCYCHVAFGFATYVSVLAGVKASCFVFFMADGHVVAIWLMFCIGRCYCHLFLWLLVLPL